MLPRERMSVNCCGSSKKSLKLSIHVFIVPALECNGCEYVPALVCNGCEYVPMPWVGPNTLD